MIAGRIVNQQMNLNDSHIAADTIDYLEATFTFTSDWNGLEKWAHFSNGATVYDIHLTDDCIRAEDHLNLGAGAWQIYLHGNKFENGKTVQRITTNVVTLYVVATGTLEGEPFPEIPVSVTERIFARLARLENGGGSSGGGFAYEIGYGLQVDENMVLSAEIGVSSFTEIPNTKVQEIFNKVMMED